MASDLAAATAAAVGGIESPAAMRRTGGDQSDAAPRFVDPFEKRKKKGRSRKSRLSGSKSRGTSGTSSRPIAKRTTRGAPSKGEPKSNLPLIGVGIALIAAFIWFVLSGDDSNNPQLWNAILNENVDFR